MIHACIIGQDERRVERLQRMLRRPGLLETAFAFSFEADIVEMLDRSTADIIVIDVADAEDRALAFSGVIMRFHPLPVVLLTDSDSVQPVRERIEAAGIGVLGVLHFPDDDTQAQEQVVRQLVLLSEVKVIRRWDGNKYESLSRTLPAEFGADTALPDAYQSDVKISIPNIVVAGASAGGTKALEEIVSHLPADFPLPILVVQHLAGGYVGGFARWLQQQTLLQVRVAEQSTPIEAGVLYLAPDNRHLTVSRENRIVLREDAPLNGFRPSIGTLFLSALDAFGSSTIAVLLSGMGVDGAQEMRALFDIGATTLAQDKETSLIYGIPGEAIKLGAARHILPVQKIAPALISFAGRRSKLTP